MKLIEEDKKQEEKEQRDKERRQAEEDAMNEALEQFRQSTAYPYVMKFFQEREDKMTQEIEAQQTEEMKKVFMLPLKEQRAKIAEMSKRNTILTGVLSIIKQVKNKL